MGGSSATLSIILKLVDDASAAMQGVGDSLKGVGAALTSAGATLSTDVTLPLAGVGFAATKAASDFQASMEQLVTQAGLPADQLQKLTDQVLAFAQSGAQQAPEELAQGLYHIVSLGVPASDAMSVLKDASEGAAIGAANLEDVANALGAAVASNIKGSGDYEQAMAVLNATVGAGNMRMQDLAQALGNVLPQATTAGLSLTDVGAAMATMTDNGMNAEDAATRLHMAISLMEAPTGAAQKALASVDMTQFQLADDMRTKGLLPALQDLQEHLKASGDTADQQAAVITAAFGGGRSAGAIELLLNNLDRLGDKYQLIDQGVSQFGQDVSSQSQTAAAKFAEAQAQMSAALVELGGAMLPLIEDVMPKLVAGVTAAVQWFTNLPRPVQDGILVFLGLFAALGPVLVVLGSAITVVGTLTEAFAMAAPVIVAVGATVAALGAPLLIAIGVVALLAAAVYLHWNDIIGWTSDMMLKVADVWTKGWQGVSDFFGAIWTGIKTGVQSAISTIEGLLNGLFSVVSSVTSKIMAPIQAVAGAVSGAAGLLGAGVNSTIKAFASGGIVTGPTLAMVGEAGPEAIIPLSAFQGGTSLAGAGGGGSGNIVINLNGPISDSNTAMQYANQIAKALQAQMRLKNFS